MKSYFEGWYFKQDNAQNAVAFIPAFHVGADGKKSASIQVITDSGAHWLDYDYARLTVDRKNFRIRVGDSVFSRDGITVDIRRPDFFVSGNLRFGALTPLKNDIMGPFRYVPFMECRHSVWSMSHSVNGELTINGSMLSFHDALGYLEGDRGSSFPKKYIWTQCVSGDCSVMLSVADIPFLSARFTGIIGAILLNGREYRIATYKGARVLEMKNGTVTVRQGPYVLTAKLHSANASDLRAPDRGGMTRLIRESPACTAEYRFTRDEETLLHVISNRASFEYEYPT